MRPLRAVAINAMFLDPGVSGGTETYLRGLVPALVAERPGLEVTVLTTGRGARALHHDGWASLARVVALRAEEGRRLRRLYAEQIVVPYQSRRGRVDVLHSLGNTGPLLPGVPHVLTLHDLQSFTTDALGRTSSLAYRLLTSAAARRADVVITGSEASRTEIRTILGVDATAVPHGAGRPPTAPADLDVIRARHRLDGGPVVLCVAAKRPHKNQELLLRALPDRATLVLVGHPEAYDARLRALAGELGVAERVRFLSHVDDDELEALWALAACAALPTRAEGFGLPVVEALRRGVPVACSDLPVLREVGGDVPAYFAPDDEEGATAALLRAMADGARAAELGPRRAARFTWPAAANGTLAAYERALA